MKDKIPNTYSYVNNIETDKKDTFSTSSISLVNFEKIKEIKNYDLIPDALLNNEILKKINYIGTIKVEINLEIYLESFRYDKKDEEKYNKPYNKYLYKIVNNVHKENIEPLNLPNKALLSTSYNDNYKQTIDNNVLLIEKMPFEEKYHRLSLEELPIGIKKILKRMQC